MAVGAAVLVVVALGCLARLHSPSTLWLDEAQSVAIARRPLPQLFQALRRDGSPPLYYLLLHAWTGVFGLSVTAVRALSTLFSLLTLPVVWLAGRRLGGPAAARTALLLLAVSPFAVRYATETRMYALVQLLTALGVLLVLRAVERPDLGRLAPVALVAGLLALTHYWALFLLAATAVTLLVLARRGADRSPATDPATRVLLALLCGGVVFLPWLPNFLFQVVHTGTPWAATPKLVDTYRTVLDWSGGTTGAGVLLTLSLLGLSLLAVCGRRVSGGVLLTRPASRTAAVLLAASLGTLLLGLVVGMLVRAGYASRYSSVAFVPALLLAALGVRVLPRRARLVALAVVVWAGLAGSLTQPFSTKRTEAAMTARAVNSLLLPADVVVYCPDQLGPAVSRLLPSGTDQVVYPTGGPAQVVDWVDYAQRNRAASPRTFAGTVAARTGGAVWLVWAPGYRTFGTQCQRLGDELAALRGVGHLVHGLSGRYVEQQQVTRYPRRTAPG